MPKKDSKIKNLKLTNARIARLWLVSLESIKIRLS